MLANLMFLILVLIVSLRLVRLWRLSDVGDLDSRPLLALVVVERFVAM